MFGKINSVKLLKTLIKFAAVTLTSPATVAVAGSLYPDNPITRFMVSMAALVLVEGCLLLGWEMLDNQGKNATMAQRWLYAGLAWVAYFSLFGVAIYHNEGVAGLVFRLTLGVMLVYASAEAGLLASVKTQKQAEKDIYKDWRVKRYSRKLSRLSAMADLDLTMRMRQLDREAREKLYTLQRERETNREIVNRKAASQKVVEMPKFDMPTLSQANEKRKLSKQQAMDRVLRILTENPDSSPTEIAVEIGRTRQTVYDYINELEREGYLNRNGTGDKVLT